MLGFPATGVRGGPRVWARTRLLLRMPAGAVAAASCHG